jgi:hypothetical protein
MVDKMTDDKIVYFIKHTTQLLTYIQTGEMITDGEEHDPDQE